MKTLERAFEVMADAPSGVKRLRELILQLAVQGKLVPQDPNDEPASILLEKIAREKAKLVKEGKIKKGKELPPVTDEEKPYDLPKGWEWCWLEHLCAHTNNAIKRGPFGSAIRKDMFVSSGYKIYEQKHAIYGDFSIGSYYINETHFDKLKDFELFPGDILISCAGTVGKLSIVPGSIERGIINQALLKIRLNDKIIPNQYFLILFPAYLMKSDTLTDLKGTAMKNIVSVKELRSIPIPLPPLAEQKRIVEKVDRLMALCDKLEETRKKKEERRVAMNASALDRLMNASGPEEFDSAWRRVRDNFHLLYDRPETVKKLRAAILQLAVQGKLVPQDPNDEPASILLEKIAREKSKLVKEGKIRQGKDLPLVSDDEKPYELPKGWEWVRLGILIDLISGQHLVNGQHNNKGQGIPYLTGPADFGDIHPTATRWTKESKVEAIMNDILITVKGAGVGKANILAMEKCSIGRQIMAIRIIDGEILYFYTWVLASLRYFQDASDGSTVPGIGRDDVMDATFPLPPLPEQKRIVAKVNRLVALCDKLETTLAASRDKATSLAASIVNHATA